MAITAQMTTDVTQLYVALFLRAPDSAGLGDWVVQLNGLVESGSTYKAAVATVAQRMYDTPDARPYYPAFWTNEQIVTEFYKKVLGREPDAAGKAGWLAALNAPGATKGVVISQLIAAVNTWVPGTDAAINAQGTMSKALFQNKVAVAEYYAATMMGGVDGATKAIASVTATSDVSTPAAIAAIIAAGGGVAGTDFNLSTGTDAGTKFTGTSGNDTYAAGEVTALKTLTAGDNLDGSTGTDTLNVSSSAVATAYSGFTLKNIEVISSTADGAQTFDLSGATGLTTVRSSNSSAAATFNEVTNLVAVEVVSLTNTGLASNVTVQYQDAVVAGATDATTVTLNNSNAQTIKIGGTTTTNAGVETINLVASGANSTIAALDTNLTTLNFSGDKNVTITAPLNLTAKTIDASTATGGLTVSTIGTDVQDITFKGGKGADQVTFAAGTLTATSSASGGDGIDRIVATQANLNTAGTASKITTFEKVQVSDQFTATGLGALTDASFKVSNFADATAFELAAGHTNGANLGSTTTGLSATQVRVDLLLNGTGTLNVFDPSSTSASDTFTLGLGKTTIDAGANNITDTVNFNKGAQLETLAIEANTKTAKGSTDVLTVTGATGTTTVNVTGAANLTLTTTGSIATTVNAATATGNLDLRGVGLSTTAGATITTNTGNDIVVGGAKADTIVVGSGNDIVYGSAGIDTVTLGSGNDTLIFTALAQSGSASTDIINDFISGEDNINVTSFNVASFGGNFANGVLAEGGLTGGGTVSAVYQQDANLLWVDVDGNGTLDANDLRVTLTGVTKLVASDLSLAGANINVVTNTAVGSATTGLPQNFVAATQAALSGATLNGGTSTDTLTITNLTGNVALGNGTTGGTVTSVENVVLSASTAQANAVTLSGAGIAVRSNVLTNGVTVDLSTGAGNSFTAANGVGTDIVSLGLTGQTATLDSGDTVAAAVAGARVTSGTGNTTINVSGLTGLTANFTDTSGAGDILSLAALGAATATTGSLSGFETLTFGRQTALQTWTLGTTTGLVTLNTDTTTANLVVNMTAAQLDGLTAVNDAAAANLATIGVSNGGVVDLTDTSFNAAFLTNGAITFVANSDVSVNNNIAMTGNGGADTVRITTNLGAATSAAAGFETVVVTAVQTGLTFANGAATESANLGGTFVLGTGGDAFTGSGAVAYTVTDSTGADSITFTGTAGNTVSVIGGDINTVNINTVNLNAVNAVADTVGFNNTAGNGVTAALNRTNITGFNSANDVIRLDVTQTTGGVVAGLNATVTASNAVGAVNFRSGTENGDVLVLNYDMGGAASVLSADLTGAGIVANMGGAITTTASDTGYIFAIDNGVGYLYYFAAATTGVNTTVDAGDIALIGTVSAAAVNGFTATNFLMAA
jgi:hypothetical protein